MLTVHVAPKEASGSGPPLSVVGKVEEVDHLVVSIRNAGQDSPDHGTLPPLNCLNLVESSGDLLVKGV